MRIGILGKSGAGKDTFADYLVEEKNFRRLAFADPLYEIAKKYFGMREKDRGLLQDIGNAMRCVDENVFVNLLTRKVNSEYEKNIVVTDVRQKNEFEALKKLGFIFIYIDTSLENRLKRIAIRDEIEITEEYVERIENNTAETGCDEIIREGKLIDFIVDNNKDIEALRDRAETITETLRTR